MDWITKSVQPGEVILSGHISGFLIPAFTARPVYLGHDLQTAYFSFKKPLMEWFYRDDSEADVKKEFLEQNQIRYVYFGPNERTSGSFDPDTKDYLEPAFAAGRVEIYKVKM
jgi:hypothetical protein